MQRSKSISTTTTIELDREDILKLLNNIDGGIPDNAEVSIDDIPFDGCDTIIVRYHETHNT